MSTANFKRFNTSNSDNYNTSHVYEDGTLVWDDSNGLRLHDGTTPGGDPLLSIHQPDTVRAQVVTTTGPDTFVVAGNVTDQYWTNIMGESIYFNNDELETQYKIVSKSYDSGNNETSIVVTPNFNSPVLSGTSVYQGVVKTQINRLIEGPGITFDQEGSNLMVMKQYNGQHDVICTNTTVANGIELLTLDCSLIVVRDEVGITTGSTQSLTLPGLSGPNYYTFPRIPVGTKITVINSRGADPIELIGWPGPGPFTLAVGDTAELVYVELQDDEPYNAWWVTNSFSWI